jgi:hypothetical protein
MTVGDNVVPMQPEVLGNPETWSKTLKQVK